MDLKKELEEAIQELNLLEKKYEGTTPAQTSTLQKLKMLDANYKSRKNVLETKIAYLKAQLEEQNLEQAKRDFIYKDCLRDAMMDDMF